jgi:hypothetical protein
MLFKNLRIEERKRSKKKEFIGTGLIYQTSNFIGRWRIQPSKVSDSSSMEC